MEHYASRSRMAVEARPSVSRDIKFSNSSRSKYNRQETHSHNILYLFISIRYKLNKAKGSTNI